MKSENGTANTIRQLLYAFICTLCVGCTSAVDRCTKTCVEEIVSNGCQLDDSDAELKERCLMICELEIEGDRLGRKAAASLRSIQKSSCELIKFN